jgi:hypothetical protein
VSGLAFDATHVRQTSAWSQVEHWLEHSLHESDEVRGLVPYALLWQLQPIEVSGEAFALIHDEHLLISVHAEHSAWQDRQDELVVRPVP